MTVAPSTACPPCWVTTPCTAALVTPCALSDPAVQMAKPAAIAKAPARRNHVAIRFPSNFGYVLRNCGPGPGRLIPAGELGHNGPNICGEPNRSSGHPCRLRRRGRTATEPTPDPVRRHPKEDDPE